MPRCCPACGGGLSITRVTCDDCSADVSGCFGPAATGAGRGPVLDEAAVELLQTLVECRDDVTAAAQRLRIGQAELDERLAALGRRLAGSAPSEADAPPLSLGDVGARAASAEPTNAIDSTAGDGRGDHARGSGVEVDLDLDEVERASAEHALLHHLAAELAALDDSAPPRH